MRFRLPHCIALALFATCLLSGCDKVNELAGQAQQKVQDATATKPAAATVDPAQPAEGASTATEAPAAQPAPAAVDPQALVAKFIAIQPELYTDDDFRSVAELSPDDLQTIEKLVIASPKVTEAGLEVALKFPALKSLSLLRMPVSPAMFKVVAMLEPLEELSLAESTFTDEGVLELAPLVHLKSLDLHKTPISDAGLPVITSLVDLEVLNLQTTTSATGITLAKKPKLTKLRVLNISESGFGTGLPYFKGIDTLEELIAERSQMKDLDLGRAGDWPALTKVNFYLCPVKDDAVIAALKNSKKLEYVTLRRTEISNRTLGTLQYCKELKELDVAETPVNPTGINALRKILPKANIIER